MKYVLMTLLLSSNLCFAVDGPTGVPPPEPPKGANGPAQPRQIMSRWDEIRNRCPKLYSQGTAFECGEGWADLILNLSIEIERILNENLANDEMFAIQVKEKYGTLRFSMSMETKAISDLIEDAEAVSSQACEVCGAFAKMRGQKWIETRCDKCYKEDNDRRNQSG